MFIVLGMLLIIGGSVSAEIVPNNITIEGVSLENLSLVEAEARLEGYFNLITITHQGHIFYYSPEQLGIEIDYRKTLKQLMERPPWDVATLNYHGVGLELEKNINQDKLAKEIRKIAEIINTPAQNSTFSLVEGDLVIVDGSKGIKVDEELFLQHITDNPLQNNYIIPFVAINPEISNVHLKELIPSKLLAQYTTDFVINANRTENIRIASEAIKGTLLSPGDVFSFNNVVGPRTKDAGFLTAMVISGGQFIPGVGGGICQVSSTLYNSVLLAGLEIVERSAHSLAIDYVPLGRDATVVYGLRDFIFKNNTLGYIFIDYQIEGQKLTFYIYGHQKWLEKVEVLEIKNNVVRIINPRVIESTDYNLLPGQVVVKAPGKKGYEVATFRTIKINGEIKEEFLSRDIYQATSRLISRGPAIE